jgi:CRP-like cAMP-binding protein
VFGEFGVLTHNLRTATVTTVTDCELAVVNGDRLREFLEAHSRIGYQVMLDMLETVAERLSSANHRMLTLLAWGLNRYNIEKDLEEPVSQKNRLV